MSQPWKSDLLVRFSRHATLVQLRAPWSRRVLAECNTDGAFATALPAALKSLRKMGHDPLPAQACLLVPEELTYLSLRPPRSSWRDAQIEAAEHFALNLGRKDLVVQVTPMPRGHGWLAAAVEPTDVQTWQRALGEAGLVLVHLQLTLLEDLRQLASTVGDRAIVALMRDEGVTLIRVSGGVPVELNWERCDPHAQRPVEQRLLAFQGSIHSSEPEPLWMLCGSAMQREQWQRLARGHRWTLLLRNARAPAAPMDMLT